MKKDEKVGSLISWGPYYRISTEFRLQSVRTDWTTILNFNVDEDQSGKDGSPRLSTRGNYLYVHYPLSQRKHNFFLSKIEVNKWYKLEILQNFTLQKVS